MKTDQTEPTAQEMSEDIWEWMGNCWHDLPENGGLYLVCLTCEKLVDSSKQLPDLTLDENLHLIRQCELRAVEVFGEHDYTLALLEALHRNSPYGRESIRMALASAAQRATAIYSLIKESGK